MKKIWKIFDDIKVTLGVSLVRDSIEFTNYKMYRVCIIPTLTFTKVKETISFSQREYLETFCFGIQIFTACVTFKIERYS